MKKLKFALISILAVMVLISGMLVSCEDTSGNGESLEESDRDTQLDDSEKENDRDTEKNSDNKEPAESDDSRDTEEGDDSKDTQNHESSTDTEEGDDSKDTVNENGTGDESNNNGDNSANTGESESREEETRPAEIELFTRYSNVKKIYPFNNGLAAFLALGKSGFMGTKVICGYIDVEGNIVIEPEYGLGYSSQISKIDPTSFDYPCIKLEGKFSDDPPARIVDNKGNILYEVGKNKVYDIGTVSQGYFWVQTLEAETVAGNVFNVVYYSAETMKPVVVFENCRAFGKSYLSNAGSLHNYHSEINAEGYAILYNAENDIFEFNIGEYDAGFVSIDADNAWEYWKDNWEQIAEFNGASRVGLHADPQDPYSAVTIQSGANVYFYSVIDREGNVLMQPTKDIGFYDDIMAYNGPDESISVFSHNMCPAYDKATKLWGYVDPQGNWVIEPQYKNASAFTEDGYASVNNTIIIDTSGQIVLEPRD